MVAFVEIGESGSGNPMTEDHASFQPEPLDERKAWQAKMATRQDPLQFDVEKLIAVMLSAHWMHECVIHPAYMPPFPREDTRPTCKVSWTEPDGGSHWLRHSAGPMQGYFWDVYGDDFLRPELALLAVSQAPPPPRIDFVIPTHGN
jgi:hypothetical protein